MIESERQQRPSPTVDVEETSNEKSFADNYSMAIALGLPFGLLFGLLILDNITWGILLGAGLAPVIAMVMTKLNADE